MATPDWSSSAYPFTPYCGAPPSPADLLHRWNLDPVLITVLIALAALYAVRQRGGGWRTASFYAGWAIGALALISPLCPLSVSLFSARVGQHLILTTVAAPLLALGRPIEVIAARPSGWSRGQGLAAAIAYAACLWVWHAPGPYLATFQSDFVYWVMHLTTIGAAFWLWSALFSEPSGGLAGFIGASLLTTLQMGFLGAVIAFAGRRLYAPHLTTTAAWGLSPLEDQQLGGAIMWVPAGMIFAAALAFAFTEALRRAKARALTRARA